MYKMYGENYLYVLFELYVLSVCTHQKNGHKGDSHRPIEPPLWWGRGKWCSTTRNGLKIATGKKEGTMCGPLQHEVMPT